MSKHYELKSSWYEALRLANALAMAYSSRYVVHRWATGEWCVHEQ